VVRSATRQRVIAAAEFFHTYLTTAIEPVEMLTEVRFPAWKRQWRWGFQEICRRDGDFALVGAVALLQMDDNAVCREARLTMFGVGGTPLRLQTVEEMLAGRPIDDKVLNDIARAVAETLEPDSDIHASAEYRQEVGGVVARRALEAAIGTAHGQGKR
jgi:aerobic carbon-monoxide dehydrogenase medium subunit